MTARCDQEMCEYWGGDGDVCPCAVFGIPRPDLVEHGDHDIHGLMVEVHPDGSQTIDEDCDCPPNCAQCEAEGAIRPEVQP